MIAFYYPLEYHTYTQTRVTIVVSETACTNSTYDFLPIRRCDYTPVNDFNFTIAPPKNWRWYDIFRTPLSQLQPKKTHSTYLQLPAYSSVAKIQEYRPRIQRQQFKRKQYINSLKRKLA